MSRAPRALQGDYAAQPEASHAELSMTLDQALACIAEVARPLGIEQVPLENAHNRVLAEPLAARLASPRCDVSAMDGYALRDTDLSCLPAVLRVAGESFAGTASVPVLRPGTAMRIFTGAPLPPSATRVVLQEDAVREGHLVTISTVGRGRHVRSAGDDFAKGAKLLDPGTVLGPRALVTVAAADVALIPVWRYPRVTVIATGDELANPGTASDRAGAIPDSLSCALAALVTESGGTIVARHRAPDALPVLETVGATAIHASDVIVVTGGASVGERDYGKAMFAPLEMLFANVAIKPGKPVWLGRVGKTLVLGLPGNPTSAMVTARLFLVPLLAGLTGRPPILGWETRLAGGVFPEAGSRETLVRAHLSQSHLVPLENQASGSQSPLAVADWLVRRPARSAAVCVGEPLCALRF